MNRQNSQLASWREKETNLFEARKAGLESVFKVTRSRKPGQSWVKPIRVEVPIFRAQAKNNRLFDTLLRNGSHGCTVRRIV